MEIESKAFGAQQPTTDTLITFPKGIPGFEEQSQFQLFQQKDSEVVFLLQSLSNDSLAFSVAHPSHFNINYHFILSDEEEALLEIDSLDDLLILLILHRDANPEKDNNPTIKGSIKSPLLINTKKRIGLQKSLVEIEQSITLTEKSSEIDVSEAQG